MLVSPYLAHILVFVLFPVGFSLFLSFHEWNIISPMEYVGLANYEKLLQDQYFLKSLRNTLVFLGIHIPLQISIALGLAVILNQQIWFRAFFRGAFFMPVVVSGVVVTILWQQLYGYEMGSINMLLMSMGLEKVGWLTDPSWAMPSIAIMATWKNVGLYIILFLVGLAIRSKIIVRSIRTGRRYGMATILVHHLAGHQPNDDHGDDPVDDRWFLFVYRTLRDDRRRSAQQHTLLGTVYL